jgi:diphthamide synthase (EF-2-diphthine--ammonia ligase)
MKKLITVLMLCVSMQASALEVKGVKVPETAQVGNETLQLNGAGLRTKFFFKVYVGALYLDKKAHTAADVLANTGAKRIAMFWKMDVDSEDIQDGFAEDFDANTTKAEKAALAPQIKTFMAVFDKFKEVKKGAVINLDYVPGEGTRISLNGKEMERIAGAEFYATLLRVWFGDHPADADLEEGMLGSD